MNEVKQVLADREFWYEVRDLIDPEMELYGFSYRNSGTYRNPDMTLSGKVARALIRQRDAIRQLQQSLACFLERKT